MGDSLDPASRVGSVSNDFSGTAHTVAQIGLLIGDVINNVHPLPQAEVVPHEVPAADWCFTNRVAEQARLPGPGLSPGVRVVVVTGLGGMGKTALIRQWVATNGSVFPGGELFVDFGGLRSRSGPGVDVAEAVAVGLRGLGVAETLMPVDLQSRANLFRTRTAQRPLLVVLDGVSEPAQVVPLVPRAAGSVVLVTSDQRLTELVERLGAQMIPLGPLDDEHARAVITQLGGAAATHADPADLTALVRLCGGHPMLLRLVAARLATDATMTVAELVADLRADGDAVDAQRFAGILDAAYSALPASAAQLYRVLGGLSLTRELAAVALDVPERAAGDALAALVAANLVEERPGRRYQLYAPAARQAGALASGDAGGEAALERLTAHYLRHAMAADAVIMGVRLRYADADSALREAGPWWAAATKTAALDWFSAERDNLLFLARTAALRGRHESVWRLSEAMMALYFNRRRPQDMIEVCLLGADSARAAGLPAVEARLRSVASRGYLDLGRHAEAKASLDRALALAESTGDRRLCASVWEYLGRCLDQVGDGAAACAAYERSLADNLAAGEARGAALARYFLARTLRTLGRHEQARTLAAASLEQFSNGAEFAADERMTARAQVTLGAILLDQGDRTAATTLVAAGVETLDRLGAWHYELEGLRLLADIAVATDNPDLARRCLLRVADVLEASGDAEGAARNRSDADALADDSTSAS